MNGKPPPRPCPHPPFSAPPLLSSPSPSGDSPQVQVLEFLKAADLRGKLLNLVIKKVKHFQILQFCYVWRHSYGNRNAECECRNICFPSKWEKDGTPAGPSCSRIYVLLNFCRCFLGSSSPPGRHGNVSSKGRKGFLCHKPSISEHYFYFFNFNFFPSSFIEIQLTYSPV